MPGRRIAYGLILIGCAAFWIYYDGAVSVYLFAVALALPLFSLLVSLPFCRGLAAEIDHARKLGLPLNQIKLPGEEAAQRGEPFEVVPRPQWWR